VEKILRAVRGHVADCSNQLLDPISDVSVFVKQQNNKLRYRTTTETPSACMSALICCCVSVLAVCEFIVFVGLP